MTENAILFGPCISELGWEILRFSALVPYYKKQNKDVKIIVFTRFDRFDLYGQHSDILIPLKIKGDGNLYRSDGYRLIGYPIEEYSRIVKLFYGKYSKRFNIIKHLYPNISGKRFADKNQFSQKNMIFDWKPRPENKIAINKYIPSDKQIVTLAPRYRKGFRRNWNGWCEFYDLLQNNNLSKNFNFVICGRSPDYIPDPKNRFYDINNIKLNDDISTIGLTIETIKRSTLTIGSQSAIPNMSMLLEVPVLEWGHQRIQHTITYNIKKTKIHFLDDMNYNIKPEIILNKMEKILRNTKR